MIIRAIAEVHTSAVCAVAGARITGTPRRNADLRLQAEYIGKSTIHRRDALVQYPTPLEDGTARAQFRFTNRSSNRSGSSILPFSSPQKKDR